MALHNPDNLLGDGYYANAAKDNEGNPRTLDVGFFTFKPSQVRYATLREAVRAGPGFRASVLNKNLLGPFVKREEAEAALSGKAPAPAAKKEEPVKAAEPEKPAEPEPEPEPEKPAEEKVEEVKVTEDVKVTDDLFGEEEATDPGMSSSGAKKKKLKKKSSSKKD